MKVLLIVLAVLFALLLCPVRLELQWQGQLSARARWLFLRFRLLPRPPKKPKAAQKPPEPKKEQKQPAPAQKPADTLAQYADLIPDLVGRLGWFVRFLLGHTRVERLELRLLVSRGDAAETAVAFGRANQAVYTALGLLQRLLAFRCAPKINIGFDFLGGEETAEGCARLALAPLTALAGAIWVAGGLLKVFLCREKDAKNA